MLRLQRTWYEEVEPEHIGTQEIDAGGAIALDLEHLIGRLIRSILDRDVTVDSHLGRSRTTVHYRWYNFRFALRLSDEQEEPVSMTGLLFLEDGTDIPWRAKRLRSWRQGERLHSEWLVEDAL